MALYLHNSLTKQTEEFKPIDPKNVTMYTCGPTVYFFQHIGNFRTFTSSDFLYRTLQFNGYDVSYIMNLTDVGHLTDDADLGEDKIEVAAEKEGISAKEVADFYIKHFLDSFDSLNLLRPKKFTRATDYIKEQIEFVQKLHAKGYTYETSDGIYFDTSKFETYGELSGLTKEAIKEGARVEINPEKKNPNDFAVWKFSPKDKMRWQEWDSPWGRGFPGWHLECSAMSIAELGNTLDIHMGGEDHKMIHHPNEIAQSECATGEKFVNYWLHVTFLQVDGGKMGKSLENGYTLDDIKSKDFSPLALRYFYMSSHYRSPLNFTWEALTNSQNALNKLYDLVATYKEEKHASPDAKYLEKFKDSLNADLNVPKALAVMWEVLKSKLPESVKVVTLLKMDEVLGLNIEDYVGFEIPQEIGDLAKTRSEYRKIGIWDKADQLRREIEEKGFVVEDSADGYKVKRKL
jgi:cysteinyl-tRNA synthetase